MYTPLAVRVIADKSTPRAGAKAVVSTEAEAIGSVPEMLHPAEKRAGAASSEINIRREIIVIVQSCEFEVSNKVSPCVMHFTPAPESSAVSRAADQGN